MPGRGTSIRTFRLAEELWQELGTAAEQLGISRSELLRRLITWYLGKGELPRKPDGQGPEPPSTR